MSVADRIAEIDKPALMERIGGRRVVLSVSGGKDSTAASLLLSELGIDHDRVHCLTGWDHLDTVRHVEGHLTERLGPITVLRPPMLMRELILSKGMFPSRMRRFCTHELKVFPLARYLREMDCDAVNVVGVRAAESLARIRLPEWDDFTVRDEVVAEVWRPLLRWSEAEVIEMHQRHDVLPCPLYLRGAERVGCWPCIFARKSEIRRIADTDPGRIAEIRELEADVARLALARYERDVEAWRAFPDPEPTDGEAEKHLRWERKKRRLESPFQAPSWFQSQSADASGRYPMTPIDEVVEWARTSRGGKQFEMFAAAGRDAGCVRWGLCELVTD